MSHILNLQIQNKGSKRGVSTAMSYRTISINQSINTDAIKNSLFLEVFFYNNEIFWSIL